MVKLKLCLIVAIVILNSKCEAATGLATIEEIGETLKDIVSTISRVVSTFKKHNPSSVSTPGPVHFPLSAIPPYNESEIIESPIQNIRVDRTVRRMMIHVRRITNNMPKYTESITETLDDMLEVIIERLDVHEGKLKVISDSLSKIHHYSTIIDGYYGDFIKFSQPKLKVAPSTIAALVESISSFKHNKLILSVSALKAFFEPREGAFIYEAFMDYFNNPKEISFDKRCDTELSLQEEIKAVYNLVMVSELRAFMMIIFSHKYGELVQTVNSDNEMKVQISSALERMSRYLQATKRVTAAASRERFRCDPPNHYLDINCFRLNELFGLYYLNERQVSAKCGYKPVILTTTPLPVHPVIAPKGYNPAHNRNVPARIFDRSRPTPSFFLHNRRKRAINSTKIIRNHVECLDMSLHSQSLLRDKYCPAHECNGILHNCKVAPKASFCEAYIGHGRRYHWINNGNNDISENDCTGNYIDTMTVARCDSFLCQCSEQGAKSTATRALNLMPQVSDIENNMVVTNVRFQKKDNVVHLQIEQGHLLPEGKIDNSTTSWVPLPDLVYFQNVPEGSFWKKEQNGLSPLIYELDYTFLRHDRTTLNLDDVISLPGYVVTGVRLNNVGEFSEESVSPLELQVQVTPYNYYLGHLNPTESNPSLWINAKTAPELPKPYQRFRSEVELSKADDPLKSLKSQNISGPNRFVNFQVTDYEKDFGQLTVPYFDSRNAGVMSLSALSGVGIIHRGQEGFGGFLATKLINVNHSKHIKYELTQQQIDYFTQF